MNSSVHPVPASSSSPGLTSRLLPRADLSALQREAMYALLDAHFEGVSRQSFERDLDEKNWAILLEDADGGIAGFSTLLAYETVFEREAASVIYSGDTIVRRDAWGTPVLPRSWIASVNHLRGLYPRGRYYWLLLTSGFRTYRFLPLFWREFFPRHDAPTPPHSSTLLEHLARERFGRQYDPATGIVRLANPQALRGDLAGIPPERLADPHVAFFADRNAGHVRGDELVCLTELCPENLTAAGRRMVRPATVAAPAPGATPTGTR